MCIPGLLPLLLLFNSIKDPIWISISSIINPISQSISMYAPDMGNSFPGGKKKAKVMKIDGQVFKLQTPIKVFEVIKDYTGHVLLESKSVKQYGIRATPMDPEDFLEAGKIYFLVELPKVQQEPAGSRRCRSEVTVTAKDRLELLMMSRRSASEISAVREESGGGGGGFDGCGSVRVKVRLPKAEVDKLIVESKNDVEVAERIVDLYVQKKKAGDNRRRLVGKGMTVG